jgi:hypothetical protein
MAFAVDDFQDLVRLLDEHPEWRAQLRRLVLTDELLALPDLMRQLTARVDDLAEAQQRTDEQLRALTESQRGTEYALTELIRRVKGMGSQLGEMRGDWLEWRYRTRAGAYFSKLLRRVHVMEAEELDALLDEAQERAVLSEAEADDVRWADLVVRGRRRDTGEATYAVAEVSAGIGADDVVRAERRAALLGRIGPTLATVAGEWIAAEAEQSAPRFGVHILVQRERREDQPPVPAT